MKCILIVIALSSSVNWAQEAPKKAAADYGKEVTLAMVPTHDDATPVRRQKCDHLATVLVDPKYGDEDLTEMSEDVLANMHSNTICAGIDLNDKDIDKLGTALSLQADVSNELLRRVATHAESEEKKYNRLQEDYKTLLAYEMTQASAPVSQSVPVVSSRVVIGNRCTPTIETEIDGNFNGWDDEVIYKMTNGEIWQQENYHYHYHYAYHPHVLIYPTSQGCHIKVDSDDDDGVVVTRVK